MNNRFKLATAVVASLMVAAIVVTFEACKKDSKPQNQPTTLTGSVITHPAHICDMNAYLDGFISSMQSCKSNDALSISEAEWHLTNIANYEYANVVSDYSDIRFDTLYSKVMVENNHITLNNLNVAHEAISQQICNLFKSLNLDDKNIKYVNTSISSNGDITTSTIITYNNSSKWFYFPNDDFCDLYFNDYTNYVANGLAVTELERIFNLIEGRPTEQSAGCRIYYTVTREQDFYYADYYDSITHQSRLFNTDGYFYTSIPKETMCYLLDSYLGLAKDFANPISSETVVMGEVDFEEGNHNYTEGNTAPVIGHHLLTVSYGMPIICPLPPSY